MLFLKFNSFIGRKTVNRAYLNIDFNLLIDIAKYYKNKKFIDTFSLF